VDDLRAVDFGELAGDLLVSLPADARDLVDALGVYSDSSSRRFSHTERVSMSPSVVPTVRLTASSGSKSSSMLTEWSCCPSSLAQRSGRRPRVPSASCMTNTFSGRSASTLSRTPRSRGGTSGVLADEQRHVRLLF